MLYKHIAALRLIHRQLAQAKVRQDTSRMLDRKLDFFFFP
jgi:hypothetical protein